MEKTKLFLVLAFALPFMFSANTTNAQKAEDEYQGLKTTKEI